MTSLVDLAENLLVQAKQLQKALDHNNIPHTSFQHDTLDDLPSADQKLRAGLLDSIHQMRQLVRGAKWSGFDIAHNWTEQLVLRIIWHYRLPHAVPLAGSATYEEIFPKTGLPSSLVARIIRAAIPLGIFDEKQPGKVSHTAISKLMATDEGYNTCIGLQVQDLGPASLELIQAWQTYGEHTAKPDQSAFSLANGGKSLFVTLAEDSERAGRFDAAMKYIVEEKNLNFDGILAGYDWSSLDRPGARVVDLGGGYGQVSQAIAKSTEFLTFTVQEMEHVATQGREKLPIELTGRVSFTAKSFLEEQHGDGPDAFLISRCLHNWSDHYCVRILRALIPAMTVSCKLLIWDSLIDEAPVRNFSDGFGLKQDMIMAVISNGKDRTVEQFRQILRESDERFVIERVNESKGSELGMIVVGWSG